MPKKDTKEEFIFKAILEHGFRYDYSKVVYINSRTEIIIICPIHGEFKKTPKRHINGRGCKQCGYNKGKPKKQYTTNTYINDVNIIHDYKYDYSLTNYINNYTNIKIICPIHGEFEQIPREHLSGHGCSRCSGNKNKNNIEFIDEAVKLHGNKYDYSLVYYINNSTYIKIICPIHGVFEQTPYAHLHNNGCKECGIIDMIRTKTKTTEEYIIDANIIHNSYYDYSKCIYEHYTKKLIIICPIHGEFKQLPHSHLSGCGCPICNESKGEKTIRLLLEQYNINHISQYKFNNCKNIRTLPFDLYLPDINTCIEYDGIQHYETNEYFGGIDSFDKIKINDKIKTEYCMNNNIALIRIKYNENIEEKLNKELCQIINGGILNQL